MNVIINRAFFNAHGNFYLNTFKGNSGGNLT